MGTGQFYANMLLIFLGVLFAASVAAIDLEPTIYSCDPTTRYRISSSGERYIEANFRCSYQDRCTPEKVRCNGLRECDNGSDELKCDTFVCLGDQFQCNNGVCRPKNHRCNGYKDCADGSDELNCDPGNVPITKIKSSSGSEPDNVIDRNDETHWNSYTRAGISQQSITSQINEYSNYWYIVFELPELYNVLTMHLLNYGDHTHDITSFKIEASMDGEIWSRVGIINNVQPGLREWQSFDGFEGFGKYIRIAMNSKHSEWQPWLREISFTGYPGKIACINGECKPQTDTSIPNWREDHRCGSDNLAPNGEAAICPSCCHNSGWCGNGPEYCSCDGCIDYTGKIACINGECKPQTAMFEPWYKGENGNNVWTDNQCRNIKHLPVESLDECIRLCKGTTGCTAFNYKGLPDSDCDLRACGKWVLGDKEIPEGGIPLYYAFKRRLECFDTYANCSEMLASYDDCYIRGRINYPDCRESCGYCSNYQKYYKENHVWDDSQCKQIASFPGSLNDCKQKCKMTLNCTAFNYKGNPNSNCDLQDCELLKNDTPKRKLFYFYRAYRQIRDNIYDCFDEYANCSVLATYEECKRNSNWMKDNCKESCGYCRCPEGFFNSVDSTQCLKIIDDEPRTWKDAKFKCNNMGLQMPQFIDSIHANRGDFWLNGRGNGAKMVLQHNRTVFNNVSCSCEINQPCKSFIGTNQCLRGKLSTHDSFYPAHCSHNYTTLCEVAPVNVHISEILASSHPHILNNEPSKVIDGNPETHWNVEQEQKDGNWTMTFELDVEYIVHRVDLLNFGDGVHDISSFKLEDSKDLANWRLVSDTYIVQTGSHEWQSFDGFTAIGKYLKLTIGETPSGWQPWLCEIRFTGYPRFFQVLDNIASLTTFKQDDIFQDDSYFVAPQGCSDNRWDECSMRCEPPPKWWPGYVAQALPPWFCDDHEKWDEDYKRCEPTWARVENDNILPRTNYLDY